MSALTSAVEAIIHDSAGRVLLCQQSQGHRLWALPGGRVRDGESPARAVIRDVREETGTEITVIDLVGIYHLIGDSAGSDLPDLHMYAFRAKISDGDIAVNAPGRIRRLAWYDPSDLPEAMTATARAAILDAAAGRAGVLVDVHRRREPEIPDADGADGAELINAG